MKYKMLAAVLAVLLLAGCTDRREGTPSAPAQSTPTQTVITPESLGREEQMMLRGDTAATLYIGEGYSVYHTKDSSLKKQEERNIALSRVVLSE